MVLDQKNVSSLVKYFSEFITPHKRQLIDKVLENRTNHIAILLEDIFQSHNASAVIRSCDCFGIQNLHIVENENNYTLNTNVTMGANNWVSVHKHAKQTKNITETAHLMKKKGYRIIATAPHNTYKSIYELDISQPILLMFGTELRGLSKEAFAVADEKVRLPMYGFTESLNLSVAVAMSLSILVEKMRKSEIKWQLSTWEKQELRLAWYKRKIKNSEEIQKRFILNTQSQQKEGG